MSEQGNLNTHKNLSLKRFGKSYLKEVFYLDGRLAKSLKLLFLKPGQLSLAHFSLSENQYVKPLKLYLIINFLFFLIIPILNTPNFQVFGFSLESLSNGNKVYKHMIDKEIQANNITTAIYSERFNANLKFNQPAFIFLVIPVFAFFLSLIMFNKKRFYIEHLIFSMHFLSFFLLSLLTIYALLQIIDFTFSSINKSGIIVGLLFIFTFLLSLLIYLVISTKMYYKTKLFTAIIKSIILFTSFLITIAAYTQFLFFYTFFALRLGY